MRTRAAMVAVLMAAVVACTPQQSPQPAAGPRDDGLVLTSALQPFDACDEALDYFVEHALDQVGPYGLAGGFYVMAEPATAAGGEDATAGGAESSAADTQRSATVQGEDFSGTNVQEAGVDEPDIVKTDGRILVTMVGGRLRVIDLTGDAPELVGELAVGEGWGGEVLLDGDRALVLGAADAGPRPMPLAEDTSRADLSIAPVMTPVSVLTLVDLSDPANPTVEARLTLDGATVSARMVDGTARVVMRSQPTGLPFVQPRGGGLRAEREAADANREVVRQSTIENWVPYFVLERDGQTTDGTLVDCERIHRPDAFAGLGLLSVLTVDLGDGFVPTGGVGVATGGETVYASTDTLYVATQQWTEQADASGPADRAVGPSLAGTSIHAFDITEPAARYVGSGDVTGTLLSQWAMSEHEGHLRVATTDGDPWAGSSESFVTVLELTPDGLHEVGRVGGLGKDERIYAVRFMGDVGYVVTFRETDPLYTLDLSDPAEPTVLGELKILGYSAYLHPVGDGLLLGVGQDATRQGQTIGTQLSLFDVSDLADPTRLHQHTVADAYSPVEYDHRAFLHWPQRDLVVVPLERYTVVERDGTKAEEHFAGVVGFTIDAAEGIEAVGEVSHGGASAQWSPPIQRSLVVGDLLFTVSELGVKASDLATLDERAWVSFRG